MRIKITEFSGAFSALIVTVSAVIAVQVASSAGFASAGTVLSPSAGFITVYSYGFLLDGFSFTTTSLPSSPGFFISLILT